MEKKNPYIFTILFNKNDADHCRVAEMLNRLGHGKAKFITEAVVFYQHHKDTLEVRREAIDYQ